MDETIAGPTNSEKATREPSETPATPIAAQADDRRQMRETAQPRHRPEPVPSAEEAKVTGEAPDELVDEILEDLAKRTGAERGAVDVIRAEAVVWRDGSLGCPEPGMMYTQALVAGYWVVLRFGGKEYDYRASESGFFKLCERRRLLGADEPVGGIRPVGNPKTEGDQDDTLALEGTQ